MDAIAKLWALFYNWLPTDIRVPVFNATSGVIGVLGALLVADLGEIKPTNEYLSAGLGFLIVLIPILINYAQKKLVDRGDVVLAKEGNEKVLELYQDKTSASQKIVNTAEKNIK